MKLNVRFLLAGALASAVVLAAVTETAVATEAKVTILYDAFGSDAAMKKDWGFSALVEVAGKRILFRHRQRSRNLCRQRQGEGR